MSGLILHNYGYHSPAVPNPGSGWVVSLPLTMKVRALTHDDSTLWIGHGLAVISTGGDMEYQGVVCPHNHISVSVADRHDRRPTTSELDRVRNNFDMVDAEEDNHSPGVARHLFLPLHLPRGTVGVCDCKADETVIVEPDGYRWSTQAARSVEP